jgi:predicted Rossmann fold nucleotide-binding protein DprA/Smf involved in DNA uptake
MAERLSWDLATGSLVIFSGLARGVDTAAHRGAIAGKGKTVAMFGTRVDVLYPRENSRLSEQILSFGGALVSEFPLGTFAAPQNFPIRNRIISRISLGVLVVEIAEYSGTRTAALWSRVATSMPSPETSPARILGIEYADQTRRKAGSDVGGCLGRTAAGCATCPHPAGRR